VFIHAFIRFRYADEVGRTAATCRSAHFSDATGLRFIVTVSCGVAVLNGGGGRAAEVFNRSAAAFDALLQYRVTDPCGRAGNGVVPAAAIVVALLQSFSIGATCFGSGCTDLSALFDATTFVAHEVDIAGFGIFPAVAGVVAGYNVAVGVTGSCSAGIAVDYLTATGSAEFFFSAFFLGTPAVTGIVAGLHMSIVNATGLNGSLAGFAAGADAAGAAFTIWAFMLSSPGTAVVAFFNKVANADALASGAFADIISVNLVKLTGSGDTYFVGVAGYRIFPVAVCVASPVGNFIGALCHVGGATIPGCIFPATGISGKEHGNQDQHACKKCLGTHKSTSLMQIVRSAT